MPNKSWKKLNGVAQPGGIYQYGSSDLFIFPPNPDRVAAQKKWLLLRGKTTVGAFASLKEAKIFVEDYFLPTRATNPAKRIGAAHPKRRSAATGAAPSKRLVSRRKVNVKKGYFPNPVKQRLIGLRYRVMMEARIGHGEWEHVASFKHRGDAVFYAQHKADTLLTHQFAVADK